MSDPSISRSDRPLPATLWFESKELSDFDNLEHDEESCLEDDDPVKQI